MTTDIAKLVARLGAALAEEKAAMAEQLEIVALSNANLKRRRLAEAEVSDVHTAIEELAEKPA